jgi:hypothetical protein
MKKLFLICCLYLISFCVKAQSFVNPSFEAWGTPTCEINTTPNSWTNFSNGWIALDEGNVSVCPTTTPSSAQNGSVYARAAASTTASGEGIVQLLSGFTVGQVYQISFYYSGCNLYGGWSNIRWNTFVDGTNINQTPAFQSSAPTWSNHTCNFVATQTTHQIGFRLHTASGIDGSGAIDNVSISCVSPPTPTIIGSTILCDNSISSYSIATLPGTMSYTWSVPNGWNVTGTTNSITVINGSNSGSISVIAANSCGTATSFPITVTVNPLPTITVNSGSVCAGQNFTLIPSGAASYTFSSGSAIVSPNASTSYSVYGTSALGCVSSSPAVSTVFFNASPVPTITAASGSICAGDTFTILPSGASSYTFSSGTIVVSPTSTSSFSVSGLGAGGCVSQSPAIVTVSVYPLPVISVVSSSSLICNGETVTLLASGASTYLWNTTSTNASLYLQPTSTTSYSVTGTSIDGCRNTASYVQKVDACTHTKNFYSDSEYVDIFPNPVDEHCYFKIKGQLFTKLTLVNSLNQEIINIQIPNEEEVMIDMSDLPRGFYFAVFYSDDRVLQSKKLFKN